MKQMETLVIVFTGWSAYLNILSVLEHMIDMLYME